MKKVFFLLLAMLSTMSFISCEKADDSASGEIKDSDATLSVSKTSLQYDAEGGTQLINITSNANYAGAECYVEWIHFKMNGTQLQVIADPNTSTQERTSKIMVCVGATADFREKKQYQNYVYVNVTQKGASSSSQIKGPKWVLVGYEAPNFTAKDVADANANAYNPIYHIDSLKMEATKTTCSGFYSETVFAKGDPWDGGSYLFRFEISQIPQELKGGSTITLYDKLSLPRHNGAKDNNNDYAQWKYFHCFCWVDCRIDDNKIRSKEEDFDKYNGYNVPIVCMKDNQPDLYDAEGYIYGEVPTGKKAGDRIKLTIVATGLGANGKNMDAVYTYEWRE